MYKEWIPRVTSLVEFFYPFKWTEDERFYLNWLEKKWIPEKDYNNEAKRLWTKFHNAIEDYIYNKPTNDLSEIDKHFNFCTMLIDLNRFKWFELKPELYLADKEERFQGTADLVIFDHIKKECIILDWKTWGIAKQTWNLPNSATKPYKKIEKTFLQLSFYAHCLRQQWWKVNKIIIAWARDDWLLTYEWKPKDDNEMETYIEAFQNWININFKNNNNKMIVEIRKPTEQYWYIQVTINEQEGVDFKKALTNSIQVIKSLNNELK